MLVHVWKQLTKMLNYVEQLLLSLESKALFESNYRDIPMTTSKNMLKPKLKWWHEKSRKVTILARSLDMKSN